MSISPLAALAAAQASFGALDWGVVFLYFVVVMGVGIWASRGQKSNRDYFLGNREMSWWLVGFSVVATETSALTFIGVPAMAFGALGYANGVFSVTGGSLLFLQLIIGYIIGRIVIAIWILPYYFKGDVYTPFQLIDRASGRSPRMVAGALSLLGMALGAGVRVMVTAIPLTLALSLSIPDWSIWYSIIIIMLFALVYTTVGGIKAVVWTDAIQYFIFVGGGLFALFYIPTLLHGSLAAPSGATGWAAVMETAGGHLDAVRTGFVSSETAATKYAGDSFFVAQLKEIFTGEFNLVMGFLPQTFGIILAFAFDQMNVQRLLGCKNLKEGRKAIMFSALLIFPQFLLFLMIGVCLYAFYQLNGFEFGMFPGDPASETLKARSDFVFPVFILTRIPPIIKGFVVAGILAAAMSSVSSALSAISSIVVMDFYRPLMAKAKKSESNLWLSKVVTVIAGIALALVAVGSKEAPFILELAFMFAGLTGGPILGAFVFLLCFKRAAKTPLIIGMAIGFAFMIAYNMSRSWHGINWPWDASLGMTVTLVATWLSSLAITAPQDRRIDLARADEE